MRIVLSMNWAAAIAFLFAAWAGLCSAATANRVLDEFVVRQWTQDNGLPSAQIADLEAGPDGFLWLAAEQTLYRFDGSLSEPLLSVNTTNQTIAAFIPLTSDAAYVSTLTAVYHCTADAPPRAMVGSGTALGANLDFLRLADGTVWGVAQEGLIRYGRKSPELFPVPGVSSHSLETRFHGGCADTEGNIWLVSQDRVFRMDTKTETYTLVPTPAIPEPSTGGFERIFAGLDGRVWLYLHPCYLFVFTPSEGWRRVETGFKPGQRLGIRTLLETSSDEVWFGTENAVYRLNNGLCSELTAADLGTPLYPSAILPSQAGGVWIALHGAGILHLRPRSVTMLRVPNLQGRQAFYALSRQPDGQLRVGVAGHGLFSGPLEKLQQEAQTPLLQNVSVAAILQEPDAVTWFATLGHYLIRQRNGGEEIVSIEHAAPLPTWNVTSLARALDGTLWAGSPSGLFYVQEHPVPLLRVVSKQQIEYLHVDHAGALFGAGGSSLILVDPRTRMLTPLAETPEASTIRVLAEDRAGRFWVGTTRGLFLYDRAAQRLAPAPGEWHQPDRCIQQFLEANDGRIWLGTRSGIIRLGDTPDAASRLYDQADGMETTECTGGFAPAGMVMDDGRLLFPTLNGIACVEPERLSHVIAPTMRPIIAYGPSVFPAGTRSATFHFSALPVSEGTHARFSWQLDDEPWSEPSAVRSATFGRLIPGPHRLAVRAIDREGGCPDPVYHTFSIRPLVWQSPLFRFAALLLALGVSGAAAALFTRRRAQLKIRRLAQERTLDLERARIARDLHDDIGAGLTRMAMLSTQGRYIPHMPQAGNDLNERIFNAARETSRALNEIVWAANPEKDETEQVATYLALYAENFLRDAGLRARVIIAPDIPAFRIPPSIRHPLFRAVKEALSNAAKHARATTVTLEIVFNGGDLVVTVADDGQGFTLSESHSGNGLTFMRARLTEIGGTLALDAAPGSGVRITFTLPLRADTEASRYVCGHPSCLPPNPEP